MQFVVLLIIDLGESILIELCNCWNGVLDEKLSSHLVEIKDYLLQIMDIIGCSSDEINRAKMTPSIKDMLESFCVGTEKKKKIPVPPKDDDLIPLSEFRSVSTNKSLKNILKGKWEEPSSSSPLTS